MRGSVRRAAEVAIGMVLALASAPPVPAAAKPVPPVVTAAVQVPEAPEADRALKRNNRPWVAIDPNNPKYVYVSWMQWHINDQPTTSGNKALIAASSDGGRTFGKPFSLREGDPQGSYEARPAVDG